MTYRQLFAQILAQVENLDDEAKIRITSRDDDNCAIGKKDVSIIRVGGVGETVLHVEQKEIRETDWSSP